MNEERRIPVSDIAEIETQGLESLQIPEREREREMALSSLLYDTTRRKGFNFFFER